MADIDFTDHNKVLIAITEVQDNEQDQRQAARDAKLFLNKRDGQWDPYAWKKMDGRYRGTFDMCTPIVDSISGEIDQSDFTLKVSPAGGDASLDVAQTLNGLIRNIYNISNARHTLAQASRSNVICGFDCVEVVQDWIDGDTFDQDLLIRPVPNPIDSVWFDIDSTKQDRSDAHWGVKLVKWTTDKFKKKYPKKTPSSVSDNKQSVAYFDTAGNFVTIGKLYYRKKRKIEIVMMTDGSVYQVDDKFKKIKGELKAAGITEEKRRTRDSWRIYSRLFDGNDWLDDEEETVFDYVPLIPIYGNFDVFENRPIYYGKLEKLYDQQRSLNYAMSRDIEDGALSPSPTMWMTREQGQGNDYSKMNTDRNPVRFYNHAEGQPPVSAASYAGGPVGSSGLQATIALSQQMISGSANSFDATQGNAMAGQSGIAGAQQIDQGNLGSIKWFKAKEVTECQLGKVLLNAIPRVYDATRQVRILEEDGTSSIVPLNTQILDEQTQQIVDLNNLAKGEYDVVCDYGPAFNSQQKETAQAFLDMAAIDPSIAQKGMDIWLKNLAIPGMDQMAERARAELVNAGIVLPEQLTDEEKDQIAQQQAQAANQPPQEDPMLIAAKAEELKGQADMTNAQTKQAVEQANAQLKDKALDIEVAKVQLSQQEFDRASSDKFNVEAAKIQQGQEKLDQAALKLQMDQQNQEFNQSLSMMKQQMDEMTAAVNNMKTIREASGAEAIVGPGVVDNFKTQSDIVSDEQGDSQE